jgi:hypothetical protein
VALPAAAAHRFLEVFKRIACVRRDDADRSNVKFASPRRRLSELQRPHRCFGYAAESWCPPKCGRSIGRMVPVALRTPTSRISPISEETGVRPGRAPEGSVAMTLCIVPAPTAGRGRCPCSNRTRRRQAKGRRSEFDRNRSIPATLGPLLRAVALRVFPLLRGEAGTFGQNGHRGFCDVRQDFNGQLIAERARRRATHSAATSTIARWRSENAIRRFSIAVTALLAVDVAPPWQR